MKRTLALAIASLAFASLAFAACGGDDNNSSSRSTSQPQSTGATSSAGDSKTNGQSSPAANQSSPAATAKAGEGQVTGSGADALKKLAGDLSGKTFQVSYEVNITQGGKPTKGSITMVQKPPKSLTSYQSADSGGGAASNFLLINDGTNSYACFKDPSTGGQCIKSKADTSAANPLALGFSLDTVLKNLTDNINVTEAGSRTIAGVDSRCFTVKQADGSEGTACFSKKDGMTSQIQATKASGSVDDSLFTPPADYKVIENPSR